ncbi:endo alpha-1,4 polygalactosaminidase, partial [Streptomyces sp. NPDC059426]
ATAAAAAAAAVAVSMSSGASASEVALPPVHGGFDYQIGGEYTPPKGVDIVSRDRADSPADGLYNICYVNAFQVQPGERDQWPDDLLLRDRDGDLVIDTHWKEPLLDISTAKKRERVAAKVNGWIDGCADKGFDAVEPDNYDSFERSKKLLTTAQAKEFMALLSEHAHAQGLAIAQKNTAELLSDRKAAGLDFAVVEECGQYDECGEFAKAYDDHVVVVEYGEEGFAKACEGWGDRLSIVLRDEDVSTDDGADYVRETC